MITSHKIKNYSNTKSFNLSFLKLKKKLVSPFMHLIKVYCKCTNYKFKWPSSHNQIPYIFWKGVVSNTVTFRSIFITNTFSIKLSPSTNDHYEASVTFSTHKIITVLITYIHCATFLKFQAFIMSWKDMCST